MERRYILEMLAGDSLEVEEHQNRFVLWFGNDQGPKFTFRIKVLCIKVSINSQITTSSLGIVKEPYLDKIQDLSSKPGMLCFFTDSQTADFESRI